LVVALLSILHARFIWFPFEPMGFTRVLTTFLAACILKTLILRIGRSATHGNYGIPITSGFLAGYVVVTVLFGAMNLVRFFIQF